MRLWGDPEPRIFGTPIIVDHGQEKTKHEHEYKVRGYNVEAGAAGTRLVNMEYGEGGQDGKTTYVLRGASPSTTLLKRCEVCGNFTTETIRGEWTASQLGLEE